MIVLNIQRYALTAQHVPLLEAAVAASTAANTLWVTPVPPKALPAVGDPGDPPG